MKDGWQKLESKDRLQLGSIKESYRDRLKNITGMFCAYMKYGMMEHIISVMQFGKTKMATHGLRDVLTMQLKALAIALACLKRKAYRRYTLLQQNALQLVPLMKHVDRQRKSLLPRLKSTANVKGKIRQKSLRTTRRKL